MPYFGNGQRAGGQARNIEDSGQEHEEEHVEDLKRLLAAIVGDESDARNCRLAGTQAKVIFRKSYSCGWIAVLPGLTESREMKLHLSSTSNHPGQAPRLGISRRPPPAARHR
jgi:hypothetical protein